MNPVSTLKAPTLPIAQPCLMHALAADLKDRIESSETAVWRMARGISAADVAAVLDVAATTVEEWEWLLVEPSAADAIRYAGALLALAADDD